MEQIDYKEKYEQAPERAKYYHDRDNIQFLENIFPELAENEDERIRKELIKQVVYIVPNNDETDNEGNVLPIYQQRIDKYIAWLEKQGGHAKFINGIQLGDKVTRNEDGVLVNLSQLKRVAKKQGKQKPDDKVEPKFHEGEWITNGDYTWKIVEVKPLDYILQSQDGNIVDDTISHVDEQFHAFTIEDAKDGDVLACKEEILLFKSYSVQGRISLYCWYNGQTNNFHSKGVADTLLTTRNKIYPATKEQRDTLEKTMADAGYTFDFEKKELKKIEQESTDKCKEWYDFIRWFVKQRTDDYTLIPSDDDIHKWGDNILNHARKVLEQNTVEWSEEDEKLTNRIEGWLDTLCGYLKDSSPECIEDVKDIVKQLKSLRPHSQWKPSDKQMNTLEHYMHTLVCNEHKEILFGLYSDLKKLKG